MGRRSSLLGVLVREMGKSANRAAAESRRQARRSDAMHSRALEREMVRYEREEQRARVRAEREAERRRIDAERERGLQQKQAAKDAAIRGWLLEFEEHEEREQDIERIANDAPEVEDRDKLYVDLAARRAFEPDAFVAPKPPHSEAKARALRKQAEQDVEAAMASFRPDTRASLRVQIGAGAIAVGGGWAFLVPDFTSSSMPLAAIGVGIVGVVVMQLEKMKHQERQRDAHRKAVEAQAHHVLEEGLQALAHDDQVKGQKALQKAQAAYDAANAAARAEFELEEDDRQQALRELADGSTPRMLEALEGALPLELPVTCAVNATVQSATVVCLDIDVPEPTILPASEAKLLATGKVSYKEKNEKRLREQYIRLVAGLALRHASEAMLSLPTCQCVSLKAFRTALDSSIGRPVRRTVLEVQFDYPTLAPMTMDGIDPVTALKHFKHRINIDKGRDLLPLDVP